MNYQELRAEKERLEELADETTERIFGKLTGIVDVLYRWEDEEMQIIYLNQDNSWVLSHIIPAAILDGNQDEIDQYVITEIQKFENG